MQPSSSDDDDDDFFDRFFRGFFAGWFNDAVFGCVFLDVLNDFGVGFFGAFGLRTKYSG